jgi:hypothetical protein
MHRALPDRPSLEYLRKEAKELLRTLQQQRPVAKLAEAQHALARQYGFPSWIRLKTHVEGPAPAASPFAGIWKANPAKSKPHPTHQFRSATLQFSVRGNVMTIAHSLVGESGEEECHRTALHVDGCEHVSDDRPGFSVVASWLASNIVQVIARKDGEVVGMGTYEVSADGRELSITDTVGDVHIVLEREWRGDHV